MKNLILYKPYNLLLLAIILLAFLSFVHFPSDLDINMHDTYFVISQKAAIGFLIAMCLFFWLVYFTIRNYPLLKSLTWFHIVATLTFIAAFFNAISNTFGLYGLPRRYYALGKFPVQSHSVEPYIVVTFIFLMAQVLFIISIVYGIVKKTKVNRAN